MATPVLKCARREEREVSLLLSSLIFHIKIYTSFLSLEQEKDGFSSFKEWVETPSHIYIGHNIIKYLNDFNKKDSI